MSRTLALHMADLGSRLCTMYDLSPARKLSLSAKPRKSRAQPGVTQKQILKSKVYMFKYSMITRWTAR